MDLHKKISEVAYELYEKRRKAKGYDLDDWLEAQAIVMAQNRVEEKLETKSSSPPKKKKESTTKRSINKAETKRKKN
jgi:hypothetical protein